MEKYYDTGESYTIINWTSNDHEKLIWPSGRLYFWNIVWKT